MQPTVTQVGVLLAPEAVIAGGAMQALRSPAQLKENLM